MGKILSALACNLDASFLQAAYPLFASGKVAAIEWSFDAIHEQAALPDWFEALLEVYGEAEALVGHGIYYDLFQGRWAPEQAAWLNHLHNLCGRYRFDHITGHFGFMTGRDFHQGAPLGVPFTQRMLALGQDRLKRMAVAAGRPVGLENLAYAYSLDAVKQHGEFLSALIEPVNGCIILDLHNCYCQAMNFQLDPATVVASYPLEKVREIHISGGSWVQAAGQTVRRDTHDASVPEPVWNLLKSTISQCPHLRYVVLEQIGESMHDAGAATAFRNDYLRLCEAVDTANQYLQPVAAYDFLSPGLAITEPALEDPGIAVEQQILISILERSSTLQEVLDGLQRSILRNSDWEIEKWPHHMLETARQIATKWAEGHEYWKA
jgi:uncharacterized protein (UPF0276 family)